MRSHFILLLCCVSAMLSGCWETDGPAKGKQNFFLQVEIVGSEGKEDVSCMAQLHKGGPAGATRRLQADEYIRLDDWHLQADSAGLSGFVYETSVPVRSFGGNHEISFLVQGEEQSLQFHYGATRLVEEIEEVGRDEDLELKLDGIPENLTDIRFSLIDTSFSSEDVQELVEPEDGVITIPREKLATLRTGPVSMELIFEKRSKIEVGGKFSGMLRATYSLRRDLLLVPRKRK
jgi:hypothetical protein